MKLEDIPGVSIAKSERLKENGYHFAESLAVANAARVDEIEGCSPQIIANAQEFVGYTSKKVDERKINYRCGDCDKLFHSHQKSALEKHRRFSKCK